MEIQIGLTVGQQNALQEFYNFLLSKDTVFVLEGYSGTGKTTLIRELLQRLPGYIALLQTVDPDYRELTVVLTATTHKAAEAFSALTGEFVSTIHSHLGLRPVKDYKTNITTLVSNAMPVEYELLFIDEASKNDQDMLDKITQQTRNCKIVFIGDRAQLLAVKATNAPVFTSGYPGAMLDETVRQVQNGKDYINPITALATQFRMTVSTGVWTPFKPDGKNIVHMGQDAFNCEIEKEFSKPHWSYADSKVLCWTNQRAQEYNDFLKGCIKGDAEMKVGDYMVCNSFVMADKKNIRTDAVVLITDIEHPFDNAGSMGRFVTVDHQCRFFMPLSLEVRQAAIKRATLSENYQLLREIDERWIDLRAVYAQTVDKSQGSTYGTVFIDVGDIAKCNMGSTIARMMYVAVSRATTKVVLTGDFG